MNDSDVEDIVLNDRETRQFGQAMLDTLRQAENLIAAAEFVLPDAAGAEEITLSWGDFDQLTGRFDIHDAAILTQALHRVAYCLHPLAAALTSVRTSDGTLVPADADAMASAAATLSNLSMQVMRELNTITTD